MDNVYSQITTSHGICTTEKQTFFTKRIKNPKVNTYLAMYIYKKYIKNKTWTKNIETVIKTSIK